MRAFLIITLLFFARAHADVLAVAGEEKITTEEFSRRLEEVRKQATNPPTSEQFLEDLIRFEIGVQEAQKMKLQNEPQVKERYRQVLYNALLEKEIGKRVEGIKIKDSELKSYYAKNPEIRLAHILIDVKANAKPEERQIAKTRAEQILADVKKSKRPFDELVKLYSDDASTKEAGGEIGYQNRTTLMPSIYDIALKMKEGEIRGLIESPYGFHIIKLIDKRDYDLADKRMIRAALFEQKRAEIFNRYFAELKKKYKIQVNKSALPSK
jgi:peptidyl-prolyl cis-trans isomerase C/peptidyl-prolyl cis-trans isomerase D